MKKNQIFLGFLLSLFSFSTPCLAQAVGVVTGASTSGDDSSVIIQKGRTSNVLPDYEVVSGDAEILGDPTAGLKESYSTWKAACQDWKKEMKEQNQDNKILSLNCGTPSIVSQPAGMRLYKSIGTYKLRVRIRDSHGRTKKE